MSNTDVEDCLGLLGKALSVPENTNLKCSLAALGAQQKNGTVKLWGKVMGYNNDYLVAQFCPNTSDPTEVSKRVSYVSVDAGLTWAPLPVPESITEEQREFCAQLRGPYMGNPAYEYKVQKELPPEEAPPMDQPPLEETPAEEEEGEAEGDEEGAEKAEEDGDANEEEEEEQRPVKKRPKFRILAMAETCRLALFVFEHDETCALVPRSSVLKVTGGAVVANRNFAGLSVDSSKQLRSYFHCVPPPENVSKPEPATKLFGAEYNASWDFLPSIQADRPVGVWSIKYDALLNMSLVQNLLFTGSVFWHKPNTNKMGQLYWGKGERNLDLCFVLP